MPRRTTTTEVAGGVTQTRDGEGFTGRRDLSLDGGEARVGALLPDFLGNRTISREVSASAGPLSAGFDGEASVDLDLDARVALLGGVVEADTPWSVEYRFPDAERLAASPYFRLVGDARHDPDKVAEVVADVPDFSLDFEVGAAFDASLRLFGELDAGLETARFDETFTLSELLPFDRFAAAPDLRSRDEGPSLFRRESAGIGPGRVVRRSRGCGRRGRSGRSPRSTRRRHRGSARCLRERLEHR